MSFRGDGRTGSSAPAKWSIALLLLPFLGLGGLGVTAIAPIPAPAPDIDRAALHAKQPATGPTGISVGRPWTGLAPETFHSRRLLDGSLHLALGHGPEQHVVRGDVGPCQHQGAQRTQVLGPLRDEHVALLVLP